MREVKKDLLTVNEFSRPGRKMPEILGLIYHWTGVPNQAAKLVRMFFEYRKFGKDGYGSAHYCIDTDGTILQMIPEGEVAYHVGSSLMDPVSGRIYTDWAREAFGKYASLPADTSPNWCTIGIEMVPIDMDGRFSTETVESARELGANLCIKYALPVDRVGTHHGVVGWKDCPRWWTNHPDEFEMFRDDLDRLISGVLW